jgi:hypothetical protein
MKKAVFLFVIILLCLPMVKAQQDTFRVKAIETKVTVAPSRSFLYLNEDNLFSIHYEGKNKMSRVELKGGTAETKDSLYNLRATTGVSAILVVYEKLKSGKEQVAYTFTYKLFSRSLPVVSLDGVVNDSFVDKFTVIALGRLKAQSKYSRDVYVITSFTMYFKNDSAGFDTLKVTGNQMTPEMKKRVDAMDVKKKGGMLVFHDIKAKGPNGKEIELPPLRVYLQDGPRLRIGM